MSGELIRVLHITARADFGGGPRHIHSLVKHLPPAVTSFIAAPTDKPFWQLFAELVGEARMAAIPHRSFEFGAMRRVAGFIRRHGIQVVHSHGKGAGIYGRPLALLTGAASVHSFHGVHLPASRLSRQGYLALERALGAVTKRHIATSTGELMNALDAGFCRKERTHLIVNGVEPPDEVVHERLWSRTPRRIIHVSRFDGAKNSLMCAEIMRSLKQRGELKHFEFHFLGDGPERGPIEDMLRRDGLSSAALFHGFQADMAPHYLGAFCCLSTSVREGMPLSLLEAMSFGVPVVASSVSGNEDVVEDGVSGCLYPLPQAESAVQCLQTLAGDEGKWRAMSGASRRRVELLFTAARTAEATAEVYQAALQK